MIPVLKKVEETENAYNMCGKRQEPRKMEEKWTSGRRMHKVKEREEKRRRRRNRREAAEGK